MLRRLVTVLAPYRAQIKALEQQLRQGRELLPSQRLALREQIADLRKRMRRARLYWKVEQRRQRNRQQRQRLTERSDELRRQGWQQVWLWMPRSVLDAARALAVRASVWQHSVIRVAIEQGLPRVSIDALAQDQMRWHRLVGWPLHKLVPDQSWNRDGMRPGPRTRKRHRYRIRPRSTLPGATPGT